VGGGREQKRAAVSLFGLRATGASVHPLPPPRPTGCPILANTTTAVNSLDEAQNSSSMEYPRRTDETRSTELLQCAGRSGSPLGLLPPSCCRRFPRNFRTLLRRQRCRPRFASDFTAFLGDCRLSCRRELFGTGVATLRGNGFHMLLKADRIRRSLLSPHDSIAYHATARK
jgi:hypothetical protein